MILALFFWQALQVPRALHSFVGNPGKGRHRARGRKSPPVADRETEAGNKDVTGVEIRERVRKGNSGQGLSKISSPLWLCHLPCQLSGPI